MAVEINGIKFKSQKLAQEHVRDILKRNEGGLIKRGPDFDFLKEMVKNHPDYENKNHRGMVAFMPVRNFARHLALDFINEDGNSFDISFLRSISGRNGSPRSEIFEAMREAVSKQTMKFFSQNISIPFECPVCRDLLWCEKDLHVDHHTNKFRDIAKEFIKSRNDNPVNFKYPHGHVQIKFKTEDREYKLAWRQFHKERADLRIICGICNTKLR